MGESTDDSVLAVREAVAEVLRAGGVVRGCSGQEVRDVCSAVMGRGGELPYDYEEFLLLAGRRCGDVAIGSGFLYPAAFVLSERVEGLLEGERSRAFPEDDRSARDAALALLVGQWFAFLEHQGHSYLILRVDRERRSAVYLVDESPPYLHIVDSPPSFADWLSAEVRQSTSRVKKVE